MSSLEIEMDLGFATLTSSTSYYDHSGDSVSENTGFYAQAGFLAFYYNFPRPMATASRTYENSAFVQELRLTSNTDGNVDYVVGAFYADQDLSSTQESFLPGFKAWWDVWSGFPAAVTGDKDFNYVRDETFKDLGIFGELTYHFSDALHGTVGMRYFDNKFTNTTLIDLPLYAGFVQPGISSFEVSDDDILLKGNLSFDVSDSVMIYGTVSEGYRRGGSNAVPTTGNYAENPGYQNYDSDSVLNTEIGIKMSTDKMRMSASLFQVKWDDVQVNTATPVWGFFAAINGEGATTKGVELELDGYVNEFFEYRLGYAFVDATLDDAIYPPGNTTTPSSLAGASLPGTPEHTLNAQGIFTTEIGQAHWINRVSAYYQSSTRNATNNTPTFNVELEAFSLWDVSTTLAWENWDATLFVRNIGNEKGVTGLFTEAYMGTAPAIGYFGNGNKQFLSLPRTLGLSVNYRF
jgi:outer membrane receptor protein involved in Fe transport